MARTSEFENDIKTVIEWEIDPAPIDPKLGTVGRVVGEAAKAAEGNSTIVGLGASSYSRSGETRVRLFDGDYGVYEKGPDRRVLTPRRDLPRRAPGVR